KGKPICTDQQCILKPNIWTPVKITQKGNYLIQTPLHIAQNGI
ncbi:2890_t:CDS:1, partial [Gigaspora margarita]